MENVMKNPISIDQVVEIANISKPTVYRKVKNGEFPQPNKVARTADRGPKKINRWEHDDVIAWAAENGRAQAEDAINLGIIDEPASKTEQLGQMLDTMGDDMTSFYAKYKKLIVPAVAGALAAVLWSAYHG